MKRALLKIAIILIVAISMSSNAQTHRDDVIDNLERASNELVLAEQQISTFLRFYDPAFVYHVGALSEANVRFNGDAAIFHIANAWAIITDIMATLPDAPATDLPTFRRMINSPRNEAPISLLLELALVQSYTARLAGAHIFANGAYDPGSNVRAAADKVQAAWREIDFASWHINDAIAEEIGN
jgi:hypothetical protein